MTIKLFVSTTDRWNRCLYVLIDEVWIRSTQQIHAVLFGLLQRIAALRRGPFLEVRGGQKRLLEAMFVPRGCSPHHLQLLLHLPASRRQRRLLTTDGQILLTQIKCSPSTYSFLISSLQVVKGELC